jgi:hypothetical protein
MVYFFFNRLNCLESTAKLFCKHIIHALTVKLFSHENLRQAVRLLHSAVPVATVVVLQRAREVLLQSRKSMGNNRVLEEAASWVVNEFADLSKDGMNGTNSIPIIITLLWCWLVGSLLRSRVY